MTREEYNEKGGEYLKENFVSNLSELQLIMKC